MRKGSDDGPCILLDEMRRQALQPDVITCDALITACEKGPMTDLAAFDEMRQQALQPNLHSGSLMRCGELAFLLMWTPTMFSSVQARRVGGQALQLFDETRQQALVPNSITYNFGSAHAKRVGCGPRSSFDEMRKQAL